MNSNEAANKSTVRENGLQVVGDPRTQLTPVVIASSDSKSLMMAASTESTMEMLSVRRKKK